MKYIVTAPTWQGWHIYVTADSEKEAAKKACEAFIWEARFDPVITKDKLAEALTGITVRRVGK